MMQQKNKIIYIKPEIIIEHAEEYIICAGSGGITATAPDMESGQPCGCDCPCDQLPPGSCHCPGCSPNDPCVFFDGPCCN